MITKNPTQLKAFIKNKATQKNTCPLVSRQYGMLFIAYNITLSAPYNNIVTFQNHFLHLYNSYHF